MGSVYIYESNATDFDTLGICGALVPTSCEFHEVANGDSSITLEHPMDSENRFTTLQENRIIKCDVPVRTTPEITSGVFVTNVERWFVKNGAGKANRAIYNGSNPSNEKHQKVLKHVPIGEYVTVVKKYSDDSRRWKVKYSYTEKKKKKTVTGFMDHSSTTLDHDEEYQITIPETLDGIEQAAPSWTIKPQLFRIHTVKKTDDAVTVNAQHISYDLMYNLTSYSTSESATLDEAANAVLNGCMDAHGFAFQTNVTGEKAGHHYRDKDPITAFLDPSDGLIPRWSAQLIRDNFELTALFQAGTNRGQLFTYGKNISGVNYSEDISDMATALRPVGESKNGNDLYLLNSFLITDSSGSTQQLSDANGIVYGLHHTLEDGQLVCDLPFARIARLDGENCKADDNTSASVVRARLKQQAVEAMLAGADAPKISISVDMILLGYTNEYSLYAGLEQVYLFDTVRVRHPRMNIDVDVTISEVKWDCLLDAPKSYTLGTVSDLTSSVASWQIQSVDGGKLVPSTVTAKQVAEGSISAEAIQAGAVVAGKLAAGAVTAGTVDSNAITAGTIATGAVYGSNLYMDDIKVNQNFSTAVAEISRADIHYAGIDWADIKGANIQALIAQCLVLKGTDGIYYTVTIDPTTLNLIATAMDPQPTQTEIDTGITSDGNRSIIDSGMSVSEMQSTQGKQMFTVLGDVIGNSLHFTSGFISKLTTNQIFTDGGTLEILSNDMADTQTQLGDASQTLGKYVERIVIDPANATITIKPATSRYDTQVRGNGFFVREDGEEITAMREKTVIAEGFRIAKPRENASTRIMMQVAPDGGVAFIPGVIRSEN